MDSPGFGSPPATEPVPLEPSVSGWSTVGGVLFSALYLWLLVWLALALVMPYVMWRWQPIVITSGSMAPLIRAGDVVLIVEPEKPVAAGQVITFEDQARPGTLITHRVVTIEPDGSYRTRGDANAVADSTPVPAAAVVGRGRLLVPLIGLPLLWSSGEPVLFASWIAVTIVAVLVVFGPRGRGRGRAARDRLGPVTSSP